MELVESVYTICNIHNYQELNLFIVASKILSSTIYPPLLPEDQKSLFASLPQHTCVITRCSLFIVMWNAIPDWNITNTCIC